MDICEKSEFTHYIKAVLRFYEQEASEVVLDVWWSVCESYSMKQIRYAMTSYTASASGAVFVPNPTDIGCLLQEVKQDKVIQAWRKVAGAMSHVGAYKDIRFDDGVIHLVVQGLGGWPALCKTVRTEMGELERRFCECYRAYCVYLAQVNDDRRSGEQLLQYPSFLRGDRKPDAFYKKHKLRVPVPVEIGELKGCAYVERTGLKPDAKEDEDRCVFGFFDGGVFAGVEVGEAR